MRKPAALLVLVALALAVSAGASSHTSSASARGLRAFGSCGELLSHVKLHAGPQVGPWGLGRAGQRAALPPGAVDAAASSGRATETSYSTTNVQEDGVDEPDMVKSNGSHLFVVAQGRLRAVDLRGIRPRLVDSLRLPEGWNHELLLSGDRLLVLSGGGAHVLPLPGLARSIAPYLPLETVLTEVDVRNPSALRVVGTLSFEAGYLSARLVGSSARVVLRTAMPLELEFATPAGSDTQALAEATARNRAVLASSRVASWIPSYTLKRRGAATKERALVQCRNVRRPASFSGLGLLTVLTIDLERGLEPVDSDAVLSDGRIVYASTGSLYVATERWADRPLPTRPENPPDGVRTAIHVFDISSPSRTQYRASGTVPGYLLNQWSLSEHRGVLRVASTEAPAWWGPAPRAESGSVVTTLDVRSGELVQLGQVGGLGRGERIYSVRFAGDVGYVVTFRQVDPLYTLDLAEPRKPSRVGELKILGYSSYLHPLGGDLVLGIGQDADDQGRVLGTQLSLFDVSDLRHPTRLHHRTLGPGFSEAESDHHAFLYWKRTGLLVVPLQAHDATPFVGAIGFRLGRTGGIEELGRVSHDGGEDAKPSPGSAPIRRSLVVGAALYTVSERGVQANSLATLAELGWAPFTSV